MKTVILWQEIPENSFWVVVDGDRRHWDEQYINATLMAAVIEEEMSSILFDGDFSFRPELKIDRETAEKLVQEGAFLISCGIIL